MNYAQLLAYANEAAVQLSHVNWNDPLISGAVSVVLLKLKHWLQIEGGKQYTVLFIRFNGEQVMLGLLTLFSLAGATWDYLTHAPGPWTGIIGQAAVIGFTTQPLYFLGLKPGLKFFRKQVEKAAQYNLDGLANARAYQGSTTQD